MRNSRRKYRSFSEMKQDRRIGLLESSSGRERKNGSGVLWQTHEILTRPCVIAAGMLHQLLERGAAWCWRQVVMAYSGLELGSTQASYSMEQPRAKQHDLQVGTEAYVEHEEVVLHPDSTERCRLCQLALGPWAERSIPCAQGIDEPDDQQKVASTSAMKMALNASSTEAAKLMEAVRSMWKR